MGGTRIALSAVALAATLATGVGIGTALADQPHMERALSILRDARAELLTAIPDKGGHRVKAIRLVNEAMDETRAGINYAAGR